MSRDVFHHHNRIVNDKPARNRQRYGDGDAGNEGGPPAPQEDEYHQDHQDHRDNQRRLNVVDGRANRQRPIKNRKNMFALGNRRLQRRNRRLDRIHGRNNVGARLPENDQVH